MRLWSISPLYLDAKGLVALWREALLARAVLSGKTKGYRRHPQLERFRAAPDPLGFLDAYLQEVADEAARRGYSFDAEKIGRPYPEARLPLTSGQLDFEKRHLREKLARRDPERLALLDSGPVGPHSLFFIVPGGVETWEKGANDPADADRALMAGRKRACAIKRRGEDAVYSVAKEWNPRQKRLSARLRSPACFDEAISLCREMHAELHDGGNAGGATAYGQLLHGARKSLFSFRPRGSFSTVAWNIWHIARIEDAVANILIGDSAQVLSPEWQDRLGIETTDTGNAFTVGDVDRFSAEINVKELLAYRKAVGKRTAKILRSLKAEDLKRKASKDGLARIMSEGVLTKESGSIWLLDFWGRKTVAGLLLMPITRHQMVHINDSLKIRARYDKANA